VFLVLIGGGVVNGFITHRWSPSDELQRAADAIQNVPVTIGEWEGEDAEIDERTMRVAAATGAFKRTYKHRETNDWISVTVMCGPHGPISLHPPTVCFTGAGWDLESDPETADVAFGQNSTCQFWQADFALSEKMQQQRIVTNWGWNNGNGWKASANPRFEYAGSPYLFKLYFTSPADFAAGEKKSLRDDFMRQFLDEFDRTVIDTLNNTTSRNEN
jgi:hypothetical protein